MAKSAKGSVAKQKGKMNSIGSGFKSRGGSSAGQPRPSKSSGRGR